MLLLSINNYQLPVFLSNKIETWWKDSYVRHFIPKIKKISACNKCLDYTSLLSLPRSLIIRYDNCAVWKRIKDLLLEYVTLRHLVTVCFCACANCLHSCKQIYLAWNDFHSYNLENTGIKICRHNEIWSSNLWFPRRETCRCCCY